MWNDLIKLGLDDFNLHKILDFFRVQENNQFLADELEAKFPRLFNPSVFELNVAAVV